MTVPAIPRHVITEQHYQIRLQMISAFDNQFQFLVVDKRPAYMNVRNDCDAQTAKFLRPTLKLDSLFVQDQAVGFNPQRPESKAAKQQEDSRQRDSDSFLPTGS